MAGQRKQDPDFWNEAAKQGEAAWNGAGDALTFGLGKPFGAGLGAAFGMGHGGTFQDRYDSIRQQQNANQLYEEQHYPVARDIGLGLGTGALVLASDGLATVPAAARLAPQTIRQGSAIPAVMQQARLGGAAAGSGGAVALLGQGVVDLAHRQFPRPSELAGAAIGGAAAGPALLYEGPGTAAGVGATVNHSVQSVLRGEPMPWGKVQQDTALGAGLGFGLGALVDAHLQNLSMLQKQDLGETLSEMKSRLLGETVAGSQQPIELSTGKTIADHLLEPVIPGKEIGVEAKFGSSATLSQRQRQALREIGPEGRYYVDHFLPADGALAVGGAGAISGAQASSAGNLPNERDAER